MNPRRHQSDTKTFEELTFEEQTKAMNMNALQFRKQLVAHLRRAEEEGRSSREVLKTRLTLLENIIDKYAAQVKEPTVTIQFKEEAEAPTEALVPTPPTEAPRGEDSFTCLQCHKTRSIFEANINFEGLRYICDSCYLSNPPITDVDAGLDEIR
jgi:hypothetical protein